jgi:hypothetical protein
MAPFTKEGYPEYKVVVNDVLTDFSFKPQVDGWHSLALTNAKKSAATVKLRKGKNTVSVIGKGPEVPSVEFIKLSSSFTKTGISDSNYKKFIESIESKALNKEYNIESQQVNSSRGTNGEIYDYYLNLPYNYTQWWALNFAPGQNVSISAGSSSFPCVIELFHISNPESYSWSAKSTTGTSNLTATIPVSGYYILLIRALNPCDMGGTTLTLCYGDGRCSTYDDCIVTYSPQVAVTPGYPTPSNFFTCKTGGDTWLFLANKSGRITAYNKDGGTTSDGYSWRLASRITTTLPDISYGMVFREYVYTPNYDICDLYMGLAAVPNSLLSLFPKLAADNSFVSGQATPPGPNEYICYDWSVEKTTPVRIASPDTAQWSKFYNDYGYTRDGATADNAAIALWILDDTTYHSVISGNNYGYIITHASVRKSSKSQYPHGFEWESKCGWSERIMHTRDALTSRGKGTAEYGKIACYYRPEPTKTISYSSLASEYSFSASDLNQITALKNQIPITVQSGFEEKYHAWKNTWSRPELAIHSNPYLYARSTEYESLLEYSLKYGKTIWPLLFDKLAQKDIFVLNLLKDLTYGGKWSFFDDNTQLEKSKPFPSTYTVLVNYCKGLLAREDVNIQKSIKDISSEGKEILNLNVSTSNNQEIKLNLDLEKDEKAVVAIYNSLGGLEYRASYNLPKGSQTVVINASNFKKGTYIVQITVGSESISKTISI